jgi:hypothetical protein
MVWMAGQRWCECDARAKHAVFRYLCWLGTFGLTRAMSGCLLLETPPTFLLLAFDLPALPDSQATSPSSGTATAPGTWTPSWSGFRRWAACALPLHRRPAALCSTSRPPHRVLVRGQECTAGQDTSPAGRHLGLSHPAGTTSCHRPARPPRAPPPADPL